MVNASAKRKRSVHEPRTLVRAPKSARMSASVSDQDSYSFDQPLRERWVDLIKDTASSLASWWSGIWFSASTFPDDGRERSPLPRRSESESSSSLRRYKSESSDRPPHAAYPRPANSRSYTPTNLVASSSKPVLPPPSDQTIIPPPPKHHETLRISRTSSISEPKTQTPDLAPKPEQVIAKLARHYGPLSDGVRKSYKPRNHIFGSEHKLNVKRELERQLYEVSKAHGYGEDFESFRRYAAYRRLITEDEKKKSRNLPQEDGEDDDIKYFKRALARAKKSMESPRPAGPFTPSLDQLQVISKTKSELARKKLKGMRIPACLPPDAIAEVEKFRRKAGIVANAGREQVKNTDLARLEPGQWLNDEIVNFYGQLIMDKTARALASKENVPNGKVPKIHYMTSFFWEKLSKQGYEGGRMARWTKKIDIFSCDIILIPINHGNAHWTSAAINFMKKRIEAYDSMGIYRGNVFKTLRSYLADEHQTKKKKPFDFSGWTDRHLETYPEQENHFDCGVFMCQTLEWISRGEESFPFTQKDMPYFRQRMMWEIGRSRLGDSL